MPEISVENEPWLGLVVLADTSRPVDAPGYYALARADEWYNVYENVTLWRGPEKREEVVLRRQLMEMECQTVHVEKGFYTCPPILEDLEADVKEESEKLLEEMANERAAEHASYIDDDARERYGDEIFIKAQFGDAIAVNGEMTFGPKYQKPPRNYVLTDLGGRWPSGEEEELEKESLVESVALTLTKKLKRSIYPEAVKQILDKLHKKEYIYWTSGSGYVEVFASKRAIRKYEGDTEREAREKEEQYQRMIKQDRQRIEEERKREAAWRAAKIKRGGFPGPKDWSPRGRLPGER